MRILFIDVAKARREVMYVPDSRTIRQILGVRDLAVTLAGGDQVFVADDGMFRFDRGFRLRTAADELSPNYIVGRQGQVEFWGPGIVMGPNETDARVEIDDLFVDFLYFPGWLPEEPTNPGSTSFRK